MPDISLIATKARRIDSGINSNKPNSGFNQEGTEQTLKYQNAADQFATDVTGYMVPFNLIHNTNGRHLNTTSIGAATINGDVRFYLNGDSEQPNYPCDTRFPNAESAFVTSTTNGYLNGPMFGIIRTETAAEAGVTQARTQTNSWNSTSNILIESSNQYMSKVANVNLSSGFRASDTDKYKNNFPHGKNYVRAFTCSFWVKVMKGSDFSSESTADSNFLSSPLRPANHSGFRNVNNTCNIAVWLFFNSNTGLYNSELGNTVIQIGPTASSPTAATGHILHNQSSGAIKFKAQATTTWTYYDFTVIADVAHSGVSTRMQIEDDKTFVSGIIDDHDYPSAMWSNMKILARNISMTHEFDAELNSMTHEYDSENNEISLVDIASSTFLSIDNLD